MFIANPIYDVVFKYLLEDIEIARELLSTILGVSIINLSVKPQETLIADTTGEIKIFHLDFRAVIDLAEGKQKTVLIELQKAKRSHDILRFRKYLGQNYLHEEVRKNAQGEVERYGLEIVTIYILGFKLEGAAVPVVKVRRVMEDAITGEVLQIEDDFINHLTHESFTIQIPYLQHNYRNKLEEVLEVFSQDNTTEDLHTINYTKSSKNPLVKKILRRLSKAAGDAQMKRKMEAEDMIERLINREMKEMKEKLAKNEQLLAENEQLLAESEQLLAKSEQEKAKLLAESEQEKAKLQKQIEDLIRQMKDA